MARWFDGMVGSFKESFRSRSRCVQRFVSDPRSDMTWIPERSNAVGASCLLFLLPASLGYPSMYVQTLISFISDFVYARQDAMFHPLDRVGAATHFGCVVVVAFRDLVALTAFVLTLLCLSAWWISSTCIVKRRWDDYVVAHVGWHIVASCTMFYVLRTSRNEPLHMQ